MAVSNNLLAFLNFIALLCSIPIISVGIWIAIKHDNQYINWLRFLVLLIGIVFLMVALSGFIGAYWNKQGLLTFYLFSMAVLIVGFLIFLVLAFIVVSPSGAYSVPGCAYKDYQLSGFSIWMRNYITDPDNWDTVRDAMSDQNVCENLNKKVLSPEQFYATRLSPIESGCCKPPTLCGYQYISPTQWINQVNTVVDLDCSNWSNQPYELCYNCDSCKAGVLESVRELWIVTNVILIVIVAVLMCIYLIACCAHKNAQTEYLFRRLQTRWGVNSEVPNTQQS